MDEDTLQRLVERGEGMSNFLKDVVPAQPRKWIYATYSTIGLALGCIQAAFGSVNAGTPNWMKASLAVYAFLGTAIGATAASNVGPSRPDPSAGS
jgi:hypothetical protein